MRFNISDNLFFVVIVTALTICGGVFINRDSYILGTICILAVVGVFMLYWGVLQHQTHIQSTIDTMNDVTDKQMLMHEGQKIKTRLLHELCEHPDLKPHTVQSVFGSSFAIADSNHGDVLDRIIHMVIKRWPGSVQYEWIKVHRTVYWTFQVEMGINIIQYLLSIDHLKNDNRS